MRRLLIAVLLLGAAVPAAAQAPGDALPVVVVDAPAEATDAPRGATAAAGDVPPPRLRYGTSVATSVRLADRMRWTTTGDAATGRAVGRLRVRSPGAASVSVAFDGLQLPGDAQLSVQSPDGSVRHGPYDADDVTAGALWTPIVPGEDAIIAIRGPAGTQDAVRGRLHRVVHGTEPLFGSSAAASPKSGSCNVDVACDVADPWRDQVDAVMKYTIDVDGVAYACTGVLVNTTAEEERPFVLTASHCGVTEETAASMVFYWNYESDTCRPPGSTESGTPISDDVQTTTGAQFRMALADPFRTDAESADVALVELPNPPPDAFDVYYAGWSRAPAAPQEGAGIHHPSGDAKRISIEEDPTRLTNLGSTTLAPNGTHIRVGDWDLGTTEPKSSGSPLFDADGRITGVLSGGEAACGNDAADWYGRFARAWEGGGTPDTQLKPWLDPIGADPLVLDGFDPTSIPVELATFDARTDNRSLVLRWTTASETNNAGFSVEMARGDASFSRRGSFVPGRGTTEQPHTYEARVDDLAPGPYRVRLVQSDLNGTRTVVARQRVEVRAEGLWVRPPSPSPARTRASLEIAVDRAAPVRAVLYDALGRPVRVLHDAVLPAHTPKRLAVDVTRLSSGPYFLRITTPTQSTTTRLTVVR